MNSDHFEILFGALVEASLPIRPVPLGFFAQPLAPGKSTRRWGFVYEYVTTYDSMYVTANFYAISSQWLGA